MRSISRRQFVSLGPLSVVAAAPAVARISSDPPAVRLPGSPDADAMYDMVLVSHFSLERVRAHLTREPGLAQAAYDWGFGDWETPLGAASHVGRRDIAEFLIEHGARPNLFTHAMLGHLDVIRAALGTVPGLARTTGPHGLTLLHHAQAGGAEAAAVAAYLEDIPTADLRETDLPLSDSDADKFIGRYSFGAGEGSVLSIMRHRRGHLVLQVGSRGGQTLRRVDKHVFSPAGVPSVRLRFHPKGESMNRLTIEGWVQEITATRR